MIKKFFDYKLQLLAGEPGAGDPGAGSQGDGGTDPDAGGTDPNAGKSGEGSSGEGEGDKKPAEKKYSDKEVNEILDKKFAEWAEKRDKEVKAAEERAKMSAEERLKAEKEDLQNELDEYKAKENKAILHQTARKALTAKNINAPDELVEMLISDTAERTTEVVDKFAELFNTAVDKAVTEKLAGKPPKKGTGGSTTLTKEQIMAIKNPIDRQKKMAENIHLFK